MKTRSPKNKNDHIRTFSYNGQEVRRDGNNTPYIFFVAGSVCTTIKLKHYHKKGDTINARLISQFNNDLGMYEFLTFEEV